MIDWLLGTFFATTVLVGLVLLAREPVRKHFGARVAYSLWLIPAARLLMPTLVTTVERAAPAVTPDVPGPIVAPTLLASVAEPSLFEQAGGWNMLFLVLWLGVAASLFMVRIRDYRRQRASILDASVQLARIGSIRIVRSTEVRGPMAFGVIDRVIAVPANFDRLYDDRERCLALDHELAHHRSGDLVANFFAFVLLCLQWFNPLAWVAYAAFRFDQEAACDARVLDKANARDRADYGRAIAKAASGRALLFASALDQRNSLLKRLNSMMKNTSAGRRNAGRLMVVATLALALPLTATRAIEYVDVAAPAAPAVPAAPEAIAPVAPTAPVVVQAAVAPVAPVAPEPKEHRTFIIDGDSKDWKELSPEQRARIRDSLAKARAELAEHRIDGEKIRIKVLNALSDSKLDSEETQRALDEAARATRIVIDQHASELRRVGQDQERIKIVMRNAEEKMKKVRIEAFQVRLNSALDEKKIEEAMERAAEAMSRADAEIQRTEKLDDHR